MINENNLILKSDSYKFSQGFSANEGQYPPGSSSLFSYVESRGGVYPETVFFGLQYYLKKYLSTPITEADVEEAKSFFAVHGVPFNYDGWMHIAKDLKGKLPVRIRAVPEGSKVPVHNVLMSLESTDAKCFWVVNWLETLLLKVWYPTTVATQSHYLRKLIRDALVETADDADAEIDFKLHSFGYRGSSSEETAGIGGAAELISFKGTDTINGIVCADNYYNSGICGFSIPASEHSTITSWSKDNEVDAYRNMIQKFGKPGAIFACVSDSYDIYKSVSVLWGTILKEEIIKSGATLVIRPDSGSPVEVVSKCLDLADEKFGSIVNSKGYKILNHVRLIQGDGVNPKSIKEILEAVKSKGFSISNIAFGMGGASLQGSNINPLNRDTQKFAFKASYIVVNGEGREVFKDPITDPGKRSKAGRLDLVVTSSPEGKLSYGTVKLEDMRVAHDMSAMKTVWENGELLVEEDFETIRKRSKQ